MKGKHYLLIMFSTLLFVMAVFMVYSIYKNSKASNELQLNKITIVGTGYTIDLTDDSTITNSPITDKTPLEESDTFVSKGNEILFIYPTQFDFDSLNRNQIDNKGIFEAYDDFSFYANSVATQLIDDSVRIIAPIEKIIEILAFDNTKTYVVR